MKAVLSNGLRVSSRPGSQLLLGAVALVLMSWGCGGQARNAGAPPPLPLGATVEVSEVPYVVTGTTVPEIRESLLTSAAEALESSHVDPHGSSLSLTYRYGHQGVYCEVTWVTIELKSAIQVPEWSDLELADSTLAAWWGTYITALRSHEDTHREYLYRQASDVARELYHIESPTCAMMPQTANSTMARIDDQYRQLNERFDRDNGTITWPSRE